MGYLNDPNAAHATADILDLRLAAPTLGMRIVRSGRPTPSATAGKVDRVWSGSEIARLLD